MKPTTKPATRRDKKKHITLVIPTKTAPVAAVPVTPAQPSLAAPGAPPRANHAAVAVRIADELGETKPFPRKQIKRIIWALGVRQSLDLVKRAKEIHAGEGLLIASGKRKRTLGGVWFTLAYTEGKPKEGRTLTRPEWRRKRKPDDGASCSQDIQAEVAHGSTD